MALRRIAATAATMLVALVALRLSAAPAPESRPTPAAEPASNEAEVRSALASFIGALNELRWDDFRAWFADDVTLFNPEIPEAASLGRIDGRDAVELVRGP